VFHLWNRGVDRQDIFSSDDDRYVFEDSSAISWAQLRERAISRRFRLPNRHIRPGTM
jgi:hypothetical protein